MRLSLICAIERCPESELEQLWPTIGRSLLALVRSGIQKEALEVGEESKKQSVIQALNPEAGGGFDKAGAVNAFLIAMVLFEPALCVLIPEQKLPGWLLPQYQQVFAESLPAHSA